MNERHYFTSQANLKVIPRRNWKQSSPNVFVSRDAFWVIRWLKSWGPSTTKSVNYSENAGRIHSFCLLSIVDAAFYESKSERGFATILQRRISTLWYNLRLLWCCVLYNLVGCVECFFFFVWPLHYPVCKCGGQSIRRRRGGTSWVQVRQGKGEAVCTDVCKVPKKGSYKRYVGVILYHVMYSL